MAVSRFFVASILALGLATPVLCQTLGPSPVKRYVLHDATSIRPSLDEALPFPSLAADQDRTVGHPRKVVTNVIQHKDTPPPPCDPSWQNFWCFGSSTSTCKLNKSCQQGEGLCLDSAGTKCYTYSDEGGHQQCASCS